jgi:peroxiredoxin
VLLWSLLVPDLATKAQASLREQKETPLSEPLAKILEDQSFTPILSQDHFLLEQPAIDFSLCDERKSAIQLQQVSAGKPVILVFYYGYYCSHCVSQLFGIQEDLHLFRELGAEVVAISADPPELTAERFEEFGRFDFPVVSDPDYAVARKYGVYSQQSGDSERTLVHGTFLIDAQGIIHWVHRGPEPFVDNKTLLVEIAKRKLATPVAQTAIEATMTKQ